MAERHAARVGSAGAAVPGAHLWRAAAGALVVLAAAVIVGATVAGQLGPFLGDVDAYWEAAMRLRGGEPLYVPYADAHASEVYRYSPWFAYAWIPLTFLPRGLVDLAWFLALAAATFVSIRHLLTPTGWMVALLLGAMLFRGAWAGNVHPLLIAGLVLAIRRPAGPAAIAVAASLKAFPLLLALVYLGRGDWRSLGVTLGLTAVLSAPLLLHDLGAYTTSPERTLSLLGFSPVAWGVVAVAAALAAVALARSRYAWLAAAVAVLAALPRMLFYDVAYLLVASKPDERAETDAGPGRGS